MSGDVLSNTSTTSLITVGGSVIGEIETSGDTDWHAVSLVAGEIYLIDLKGADGDHDGWLPGCAISGSKLHTC